MHSATDDRSYWATRAQALGVRAGGNIDVLKYRHDEKRRRAAFLRTVHVRPMTRVLDVGAGVGNWCFWLERLGCRVAGLDFSEDMVRMAKGQAEAGESVAVFCVGCAEEAPFRGSAFDLVIAMTVLQHITDERRYDTAVGEMVRLVRPEGTIVLCEDLPVAGGRTERPPHVVVRARERHVEAFARAGCVLRRETGVLFLGHRPYHLCRMLTARIARAARGVSDGEPAPTPGAFATTLAEAVLAASGFVDGLAARAPLPLARWSRTVLMDFHKIGGPGTGAAP